MTRALTAALLLGLVTARAPEFRVVSGERIEKSQSTWGYAKKSNDDLRIEKGSDSIAWVKKRNSKWAIETFGGSTLAWINGGRIEKYNGETWTDLATARKFVDGPDEVAAALWVLRQLGKI